MALQLVLGRAGSGKSSLMYDEIDRLAKTDPSGSPLWLLVPEQATSQAEQKLASGALSGIMRVRVSSFRRLAYQALHEVQGAARVQVGELGRHMLIRRVIEQHGQELRTFHRAAKRSGFTAKVAEALAELKTHRVSPGDLAALLSEGEGRLSKTLLNKLHDLNLLYGHLSEQYGETHLDAADCLDLLAENIPHMPSVIGNPIWLDGFNGFTPQEYAIIGAMLSVCPRVTVNLSMPQELLQQRLREEDVFYTPWETAKRLQRLAADVGAEIAPSLKLAEINLRSRSNPALLYLEKYYFDRSAAPYEAEPQGLTLVAAGNRRAEAEWAAAEILRLCNEENYRYRDISLTLRSFDDYDSLLSTTFNDFGIPHFVDSKRRIEHHPLPELVRSSLETVLEGFAYEPLFRALKTDLFPLTREICDRLENHALATGLRGLRRWEDETGWPEGDAAEDELLKARATVAKLLGGLDRELKAAKTAEEYTRALYDFLTEVAAEDSLLSWAEEAAAQGELERAGLDSQTWQIFLGLLEELVAALGPEELSLAEYARILESGLEALELGLIPPELDQVIITGLGRSRNPEVKAALVLGATEGVLPARQRSEGLFTEQERAVLAVQRLTLGHSADQKLFNEQFLIYMALTRASEKLYLSYPLANQDGSSLAASSVIKRLQKLFPQIPLKEHPLTPENLSGEALLPYVRHPGQALGHLAVRLREAWQGLPQDVLWWDVYSHLLETPRQQEDLLSILRQLRHHNQEKPLVSGTVRRLYGRNLRASISRIEKYNACPFAFFSAYGLKLEERPIYRLAALDLGNFFHAAMDRFVEELDRRHLDWGQLADEQYKNLTQKVVAEISPTLQNQILESSHRHRHIAKKLERTVQRSARVLGKHAAAGAFRPLGVELIFGPEGEVPGLALTLNDGTVMQVAGRIDRLDVAQTAGSDSYLRVIDYKSGSSKLTPMEVYYGLKMQLLTYLHVAEKCATELLPQATKAAGALYFRIHNPLENSQTPPPEELTGYEAEPYRMQGFLLNDPAAIELMHRGLKGRSELIPVSINRDGSLRKADNLLQEEELEQLRQHLERVFKQAGEDILAGNVSIAPYRLDSDTACRFCSYRAVCQFDPLVPGSDYRRLEKLKKEEVMAAIRQEQEATR